ncbi:tpr repeat protein [Apiospora marii]|uniref:Tpr repeat protein n=1 Tax=Apiospora marii TaxID=335849 RepID=A0ABR1SBV8_9PEZI
MHIEEITDELAAKLQVSSDSQQDGLKDKSDNGEPVAAGPELSPGRAMTHRKTVDEVVAELKQSPFFMTDLEENDETEALKAMAYEGSPLEVATDFKNKGNECFKVKGWWDAKEFYTKAIQVLAVEERKRAAAAKGEALPDAPPTTTSVAEEEKGEVVGEEEIQEQRKVLEASYVNRAACQLELKNYRSCWLDCAGALRLNPRNVKAFYRSARALLAVDRIAEADDACARGLALDEQNAALRAVARDILKRNELVTAKQRKDDERAAREKRREALLKAALQARNITTRSTEKPPEMEGAKVQLVPDPDDPRSAVSFPALLLYPADYETDFIKAFNETETLADHLGYVFPLPWDQKGEYTLANVECYMDTISGGIIKVGKKVSLLKLLSSNNVEVIDQVVRLFVLPKAKAEGWLKSYKEEKAKRMGR